MSTTVLTTEPPSPTLAALLAWLRQQRAAGSVHYDAQQQLWQVFGYADVQRVLTDPAAFSSDFSVLLPSQPDFELFAKGNFVRMDPPKHRQLRSLITQAFTPHVVAGLAPRIRAVATALLDELSGTARFDVVDRLAYPLPVIVIAELLGIPVADRVIFRQWADALFSRNNQSTGIRVDAATLEAFVPTIREMNRYLLAYIQHRRTHPADDLTSRLVGAEIDGARLDDQEIVGFVGLLLLAGHITTTALLGNAILTLDEHPAAAAALRTDATGLPTALEEVLRYRPPFPRLARRTATEVELGGHVIAANQIILLWIAAANRDATQFPDPDRFDIHRVPNQHLAFGHGIHFCLGAPLARLEATLALGLLLERYREIAVARDAPAEWYHPWTMISAKRLPVDVVAAA
jgi:cytochrome P450